jgi:hypothetical protein
MGLGPNYVLSKGFLGEGAAAFTKGEIVVMGAAVQGAARATSTGATNNFLGVVSETVEVAKITTGKAEVQVDIMGIARVIAGAAITKGAKLTNDTSCRATPITRAGAGAQPQNSFGIALTTTATVGEHIDVLLTPGASY